MLIDIVEEETVRHRFSFLILLYKHALHRFLIRGACCAFQRLLDKGSSVPLLLASANHRHQHKIRKANPLNGFAFIEIRYHKIFNPEYLGSYNRNQKCAQ